MDVHGHFAGDWAFGWVDAAGQDSALARTGHDRCQVGERLGSKYYACQCLQTLQRGPILRGPPVTVDDYVRPLPLWMQRSSNTYSARDAKDARQFWQRSCNFGARSRA